MPHIHLAKYVPVNVQSADLLIFLTFILLTLITHGQSSKISSETKVSVWSLAAERHTIMLPRSAARRVSNLIHSPDSEFRIPFPQDYTALTGRAVGVLYNITEHIDPCENDCQIML